MFSPYRINSNSVKKQQKKTKIDNNGDLKRPQMISRHLQMIKKQKQKIL